jgi:CO/xanthine dehydrogenase Mo-binding subunit
MDIPLCYFLAKATGRPVKMVMSYTEELMAGNPRHPSIITLKTGVTTDGRIVARQARAIYNGGAYAAFKPTPHVNLHGAGQGGGVYRIPNLEIESLCVYTNNVPCGHARAPGEPQMIFAVESHTDMIARELGIDPVEFRKKNLLKDGDHVIGGPKLERVKAEETLDAALKAIQWNAPKPRPFIGRGIAMSHRAIGIGEANARLRLEEDGSVTLITALPDTGTGAYTMLQQVVAEVLRLPLDRIRIRVGDTDTFENESGVGGSRITHVAGQAALQAASLLRDRLLEEARALLNTKKEVLPKKKWRKSR